MILMLAALSPDALADTVYQTPDDFLHEVFGDAPKPQVLWLDRAVQDRLVKLMGHSYRQARVRYWRAAGKTVWILEEIGKEYPITAGFAVQDSRIQAARVLVYRENRGMEIHFPAFLAQFAGAQLADDRLSRNIDGISGATLSVQAMQHMARVALYLDRIAQ